ncbi:MAG: 16S rRNA (uracil(1498)-N(3))-methyltransferase [Deltaproteobacteria bacterium]|nr:16S rRNA (uracil(1498)-N(3))-methyltransferase [Deltaproteobacteria bacterium]
MTIPRVFLPSPMGVGSLCDLREEDQTYIKSVLRLKKNDHLVVFDGEGHEYQAMIHEMKNNRIVVEILKKHRFQDKPIRITLSQALPKAGKMDFIIQKATELGVDRIIPFQSARSVSRLTDDKKRQKALRWQKIAVEAARQCGRADVPVVSPCLDFPEMISDEGCKGFKIIFWEEEMQCGIRDVLNQKDRPLTDEFFVIVGPEGGFLKEEVNQAREAGFQSVSLGRQILRVDTAALAIMAIIQYEKGILGGSPDAGSGQ